MSEELEQAIITSWVENASPWQDAVRNRRIASRQRVTNQAIIAAVQRCSPKSLLDLGCGEGWLVRSLQAQGITCTGVDAVPELIASARAAGPGDYRVCAYHDLAEEFPEQRFDAVVCNFSLLGKESVEALMRQVPALLTLHGRCIVQTVHPLNLPVEERGEDGWRCETWHGFGGDFRAHSPWFYRTRVSWLRLIEQAGLQPESVEEPCFPESNQPASLILVAKSRLSECAATRNEQV